MNGIICPDEKTVNIEVAKPRELTELVRGNEQHLIDEIKPLVRFQSVALDLTAVERIDAAGIAALIALYRIANASGHEFFISSVSPRVAEMLTIVGLDGILLSQNAKLSSHSAPRLARNAA
jgi:anti-anti-sigma factor